MTLQYTFELVRSKEAYLCHLSLRRAIFCEEQKLFDGSDEDEWDASAYPIVAVARDDSDGVRRDPLEHEIAGTVRIYEVEPRIWYGGRLGVAPDHRSRGIVGRGLVRKAVSTAHAWGCDRFLALVQTQNVRLFESLAWRSIEPRMHRGREHHLMQADLASYPPEFDPRPPPETSWR